MSAPSYGVGPSGPELAVIVPTFRHPVLLTEALNSALKQRTSFEYLIVVCSDGCPLVETDLIASAMAMANEGLIYLRSANRGPGGARNFGIDYVLENYPSVEALYFLDSDNLLAETALETGYRALREAPGIGWIYPNIDSFGVKWAANYGAPYSPLLHTIYENFCDTGSFVSRDIVDAGVRFDESALTGYEDWDFWLQALSLGFRGRYAPFGFSYRQRPESRFREMNRLRGSMLERLRRRHGAISTAQNLLLWEHQDNPRYLLVDSETKSLAAFTDPLAAPLEIARSQFEGDLWASLNAGDETWTPAFFVFGSREIVAELGRVGLAQNMFLLMERDAGNGIAALSVGAAKDSIELGKIDGDAARALARKAQLLMVTSQYVKEAIAAETWEPADAASESIAAIRLQAPLPGEPLTALAWESMVDAIGVWRESIFAARKLQRWAWRPAVLPDRSTYYDILCHFLNASEITPRLPSDGLDVGFVIPIASFGGAEKVAYALAEELRRQPGVRTHLFVLGKPKMNIVSEYSHAFDSINFLADPAIPVWGGPETIFGQPVHLSDSKEIKTDRLTGLFAGLDLVINCQSAPANSVMGALRRMKIKTVAYLHLIDFSEARRPVGHPYMTVGFEHAYDLIVTCSRRLASQLHAFGVPEEKLLPIANAASFRISESARDRARTERAAPRDERALRCLYLGRLDHQKGVERLYGCVSQLSAGRVPIEFRMVGSNLVNEGGMDWARKFRDLEVEIAPPVFTSDGLTELYAWADVLLLPSRWEGAPLVILECQQLGCIPICADVGAVSELIDHQEDGLLVADDDDDIFATAMADQVRRIVEDDALRRKIAAAGIARAVDNQWQANFAPLVAWISSNVKPKQHPARMKPISCA